MNKLTIFMLSTIISSFALADFEIPNQFEDGQVTSASQMNENFQALKSEIEVLRAEMEKSKAESIAQFQGFTVETFSGVSSADTWAKACYDLAPESRVCFDHEVLLSSYSDSLSIPSDDGWVYRERVDGDWKYSGCPFDYSGWFLTNGKNSLGNASCNDLKKVACCK